MYFTSSWLVCFHVHVFWRVSAQSNTSRKHPRGTYGIEMDANPNVVYAAGDEANPSASPRCFICYQLIQEPVVLPCHHEMCRECFQRSVETANFNCPVCRKRYSSWARRHANDPVDKKRKLELHHYYEKFDSLDTLELLLDISGEKLTIERI